MSVLKQLYTYLPFALFSGYTGPPHAPGISLQQLEHANQRSGFTNEDKYKLQQVCFIHTFQ